MPVAERPHQLQTLTPARFILVPQPSPPRLAVPAQTPAAYLERLHTIPQLPSPPEVLLLSAVAQSMPLHHDPPRYLEHLLKTPQLPERTSTKHRSPIVLAARSTFATDAEAHAAFEQFLSEKKVYERARYYGWSCSALLDQDDIAQMAVIQLWQTWWNGDEPLRSSHIRFAIRDASRGNKWNGRILRGKDPHSAAIESAPTTSDLLRDEQQATPHEALDFLLNRKPRWENLRGMDGVDRRIDVEEAIQTVIIYMMFIESLKKGRHRTDPRLVPDKLDTLFTGFMYYRNGGAIGHIGGRHNSAMQEYWESCKLYKSTALKWRDRVFPIMAGLLAEYALPEKES